MTAGGKKVGDATSCDALARFGADYVNSCRFYLDSCEAQKTRDMAELLVPDDNPPVAVHPKRCRVLAVELPLTTRPFTIDELGKLGYHPPETGTTTGVSSLSRPDTPKGTPHEESAPPPPPHVEATCRAPTCFSIPFDLLGFRPHLTPEGSSSRDFTLYVPNSSTRMGMNLTIEYTCIRKSDEYHFVYEIRKQGGASLGGQQTLTFRSLITAWQRGAIEVEGNLQSPVVRLVLH